VAPVVASESFIGDVHVGETVKLFVRGSNSAPRLRNPDDVPFNERDDVLRINCVTGGERIGISVSKRRAFGEERLLPELPEVFPPRLPT
jgi:hypothetical protein